MARQDKTEVAAAAQVQNAVLRTIAGRLGGDLDANNSVEVTLDAAGGAADDWSGAWTDVLDHAAITIEASATALGIGYAEWSDDGATVRHANSTPFLGAGNFILPVQGRYYRLRFENISATTSDFFVHTTLKSQPGSPFSIPVSAPLDPSFPAQVVQAVSIGRQPDGDYVQVFASGQAQDVDGNPVSSDTPLAAAGVYQSGWVDTDGYAGIELTVAADQISGDMGILLEFTDDANAVAPEVIDTKTRTYGAADVSNGGATFRFPVIGDGVRFSYTNGGTPQGSFRLVAQLHAVTTELPRGELISQVGPTAEAVMTRSALFAPSSLDGVWANLNRTPGVDDSAGRQGLDVFLVGAESFDIRSLQMWSSATRATTSVAVEATSSSPLAGRKTITIKASASNNRRLHIGPTSAVGTSQASLEAGESLTLDLDDTAEVWVKASDGSAQSFSVVEIA